jgi:hypothetical protein
LEEDETLRWRGRIGIRGHGKEFVAFAFAEDIEAEVRCSITDRHGAGASFALECLDQVRYNSPALVVEDLAGTKFPDVVEVLGGGGGDDFVAGSDSELDCVAADACRAAPDEYGLAAWLHGDGGAGILEC